MKIRSLLLVLISGSNYECSTRPNILLNLYQYSQETRDEFFKVLEAIESRVWIPFHVALEYQRRRLDIIKDEKSVFTKINKKLENIIGIVEKDFSDFNLKDRNPVLFEMKEKFRKDICGLVEGFQQDVNMQDDAQPSVRSEDEVRVKLDELFMNKVGEEPNEEFLRKTYEGGETRYKKKIPPGYKDSNKEKNPEEANFLFNGIEYQRKFGDLIIWKQIVSYSKDSDTLKNVIFVTDDSKEDWWEIIDSRGEKVIGARPELKNEIYKEAEIESFKMYHTNDFLTDAEKYYDISIDETAIDEAKEHLNYSKYFELDLIDDLNSGQNIVDTSSAAQKLWSTLNASRNTIDTRSEMQKILDDLEASKNMLDGRSAAHKLFDTLNTSQTVVDTHSAAHKLFDTLNASQTVIDTRSVAQKLSDALNASQNAIDTRSNIQKILDNLDTNQNTIDKKRNDEDD
ncbi:PIN-like domain-containing protein [Psychrobacter sp. AH5]|uniref:PIN-like domain-containing protein n=1 Tax=Psychrobacter sp. AH5 TaxID=2937433 RepID=UPI0033403FCA